MNFDSIKPFIGQAVRWGVAFLVGKFGMDAASAEAGDIAGAAVVIVTFVASLAWSKWADKKVVEKAVK